MARIVCPSCGSQSVVADAGEPAPCVQCGHELPNQTQTGGSDWQADDEVLVAELRHAFGVGREGERGREPVSVRGFRSSGASSVLGSPRGALPPGTRLADFEIIDELGRGGMGVVYRARQLSLRREIALKVLPDYARHGRTGVRRFQNEAQAAARLNHTNIVPIYAQGEYEGNYYYAMKLVEGASLDTVIRTHPELLSSTHHSRSASAPIRAMSRSRDDSSMGRFGEDRSPPVPTSPIRRTRDDYCFIASLMAGVADGLAHAHANGVIHRDIKPHNLLFGPDRQLYITDFGLAHLTSEPHLTITGEVLGTPSYMSPEQARGDLGAITDRTDIYSFGATLYEMVTGHQPFERDSRHQIIDAVCHDEPPRPRRLDRRVPVDLETICLRAIEKEPKRRYDSAAALAEDLRRFSEDRPVLSRRIGVMERAAKWTRRHKAIATAAVIAVAFVTVSTGWAVSTVAGHRRDGDQLVQSVYDQLVHRDKNKVGLVAADIERAEALGATDRRLYIVRALLDLKASGNDAAIERIEQLLAEDPGNREALYFLAWAQYRNQQDEHFQATFAEAEDLGGPRTAEEWFFRGLALHKSDAEQAAESYRTAGRIRAANDQFFPQAELQLARALNQRLYEMQSLDTFREAEDTFRGLIKTEHYRGYADYLLSLTFRLAAEILEGEPDERSHYLAEEYFSEALNSAREGRRARPASDRPLTAEAMCLERLGRLDEALVARDQAIELAEPGEHRCEGYHYRWRLNYWLGNLEEALADIEEHAHDPSCIPPDPTTEAAGRQSLSYMYFFPALIHAEGGDLETALELVREASTQEELGAEAVLLSAAYLRILGEPDEAAALLSERIMDAVRTDPDEALSWGARWKEAMYAYVADEAPFQLLEDLAHDAEFLEEGGHKSLIPRRLLGQAHFHAAAKALAAGNRDRAIVAFEQAHRSWDGSTKFSYHGRLMLEQLSGKAGWPAWIRVVPEDETEAYSTKR